MKFYFRIFSSIFLLFFYSCAFDVEDDQRLFITGTLVDENQNPVPDIFIFSEVSGYRLGTTKTDASGEFSFSSLESYHDDFSILINHHSDHPDSTFTSVYYTNTATNGKRNKDEYDLGEVVIRHKADLDFKILKTSTEEKDLTWSLQITTAECRYTYHNDYLIEEETFCYPQSYISRSLHTENPNYERKLSTLKNTTAEFTYRINDTPKQTIVVNLNEFHNSYVFEY